jgi:hypothetical protein
MDAHRVLLVAVVCLGVAGPVAQAQDPAVTAQAAREKAPAKPWTQVRGFGRVLNLSNPPVVIDEPGLYAIDRDWEIPDTTTTVVPELIQITADDVELDLHGFEITAAPPDFSSTTLFVITGSRTEIRNGGFEAGGDGGTAVRSTGGVGLHHVSISSGETMTFTGATITDSQLGSRLEMRFEASSRLERNTISCGRGLRCVRFLGSDSEFTGNRLSMSQGGGIEVVGDGNTVANNFVDLSDDVDGETVFDIKGDNNVVRGNTALVGNGSIGDPLWAISGTANTLDGNIAAPGRFGERARTGMAFTADGNFYGNNRMAAQTAFVLGGTVQTDWGGNVGY